MKVYITEKQFKSLAQKKSDIEMDEQIDSGNGEPKIGTSDNQKGGKGYPEVSTWEDVVGSTLTRGPANQIKNTKWEDVVGSTLTRGPANQIKETDISVETILREFDFSGLRYMPVMVGATPMGATMDDIWEFVKDHQIWFQVGGSIAAAIATGGASLWVQALAQVAIQLPFSIMELKSGDNIGAAVSLVISALPVASRVLKLGTWVNFKALGELEKLIPKLGTAKTAEEVANVAKSLSPDGKVLLSRLLHQTPKELENIVGTAVKTGLQKGVKTGTIDAAKIPLKQQMWWKHLGVELPVAGGVIKGGEYLNTNKEISAINNAGYTDGVDY